MRLASVFLFSMHTSFGFRRPIAIAAIINAGNMVEERQRSVVVE